MLNCVPNLEKLYIEPEDSRARKQVARQPDQLLRIDRPSATALECMRIESWSVCKPWTARFNFVSSELFNGSLDDLHAEQVHDLSTADPFQS